MAAPASSGIEIRSVSVEEMDRFGFVLGTVFASHDTDPARHIRNFMKPEWTTCLLEDGELVTTFAAWPFTMRLNGAAIPIAGVTTVGTLPHRRRRGHLRRVMLQAFGEQRDRGQSLGVLWPTMAAIYWRFGYAVASLHQRYEIDPREVRFAAGPQPTGTVRLADAQELPLLKQIYRAFVASRNGPLHRSERLWRGGIFDARDPKDGPAYVAIYEERGEPLGYVVYRTRSGDEGDPVERSHRLTVLDLAWLSPAAYVALWQHLAGHDLVFRIRMENAPEDDPIVYLLQEPRALRRTAHEGIMLRVIDVERALPQRPYGAPALLVFEVIDHDCDWNHGLWELETDGRYTEVRRSQRAPQLRIPAHALSAMVNGFLAPSVLAEQGRLAVEDPAALAEWDGAFRTRYRPHCPDHF